MPGVILSRIRRGGTGIEFARDLQDVINTVELCEFMIRQNHERGLRNNG
jgi:hypothetical protein